jgi:hypothetical protein
MSEKTADIASEAVPKEMADDTSENIEIRYGNRTTLFGTMAEGLIYMILVQTLVAIVVYYTLAYSPEITALYATTLIIAALVFIMNTVKIFVFTGFIIKAIIDYRHAKLE